MISAKEAREQATSINNDNFKKYIAEIEKKIAAAINSGQTTATAYFGEMGGFLDTVTSHLQVLGYSVDSSKYEDFKDGTITTIVISW